MRTTPTDDGAGRARGAAHLGARDGRRRRHDPLPRGTGGHRDGRRLRPGEDESCGAVSCLARRRYGTSATSRGRSACSSSSRRARPSPTRSGPPRWCQKVGKDVSFQGLPTSGPTQGRRPARGAAVGHAADPRAAGRCRGFGSRTVDVGILDSGIDGRHPDFLVGGSGSNVDCARGRDFVPLGGPGVGNQEPCTDNQFHGTHVAGTIAAQANSLGIVGVAPNVTLVPVKVCDATGYCYTQLGRRRHHVRGRRTARRHQHELLRRRRRVPAVDRVQVLEAVAQRLQAGRRACRPCPAQPGRHPGGGARQLRSDLAHPDGYDNEYDVVPAPETPGVIGVSALGNRSEKAGYSNYGTGKNDVAAPGGNGDRRLPDDHPLDAPRRRLHASREPRWRRRTPRAWPR